MTETQTHVSHNLVSLTLGTFMENMRGRKERTFHRFAVPFFFFFFFPFSLHKSFIVGSFWPGFIFLRECLFVFLSLSICRLRLTLLFLLAACVSRIKAMEWLANPWPSHPSNLKSSFSHNNFTRPRETSVSSEDMGAFCKCVCFSFAVRK